MTFLYLSVSALSVSQIINSSLLVLLGLYMQLTELAQPQISYLAEQV